MASLKISNEKDKKWLTQKHLAERWHVSQGTIISWREAGKLPFFRLPGTNRVLYPLQDIQLLEKQNTTDVKEDEQTERKVVELIRKKLAVSANPEKEWRI